MSDKDIRTEGGAKVEGDAQIEGGDFVGRDKHIDAGTYIEHATYVLPSPDAQQKELVVDTLLKNRYRLNREIGRGGIGIVYEAQDTLLDRTVAIKVLRSDIFNDESRARLLREARTVAKLEHPNIVAVYDVGELNNMPYFVMQLVKGETLRQRKPADIRQTIVITKQLCSALDYAHAQGVVHRDMKPENVILTTSGMVKLMDFGLARLETSNLTQEGAILGTVSYLAPEQLRGEKVDRRADLYGLGIMLYEWVTGDVPFTGDNPMAVLTQHLIATPAPPSATRPDLPPGLEAIILKLLSKQPEDRYASAGEVFGMLSSLETIILPPGTYLIDESPATGEAPYKGLDYFNIADSELFFGRRALTVQLIQRLKEEPFLAVVGASGSGKSSLLRAGLAPALMQGESFGETMLPVPGSQNWLYLILTPGAHPLRELADSLAGDQESLTSVTTLMDDLERDERCLDLAAGRLLKRKGQERLLLIVDQFEEIFTLCRSESERKAFIHNLLAATDEETGGVTSVVITLRADFYHHCAKYERLRLALEKHQAYIGAMDEVEMRQVIEEPARMGDWALEAGLADLILQDVGSEPGALPLLSHALLETWKRRRGRLMTLAGYREAGGVRGAIAQTAESVYQGLSAPEQEAARNIFLRLTELGEGTQDTRRRVKLDELVLSSEQVPLLESVMRTLAQSRLVTITLDSVEVAHEAIIREWPALRQWLEQDRESLQMQRRLTEAALSWDRLQRDPGDLYRGARLAQALEWAKSHTTELNPLERAFLSAGREAEQRAARARRARWVGVIGAFALALAVVSVTLTLALTGQLNRMVYNPALRPAIPPEEWVTIPAGEFLMGRAGQLSIPMPTECVGCDPVAEQPQHAVYVEAFQIMAHAVTNRQYLQCVRAEICTPPGNQNYTDREFAGRPVVDISWEDALGFCQWAGARLLTEAEWEKAARGGLVGAEYSWGDDVLDCSRANYADCVGDTVAVGSYSPNGYGLYDMTGNSWTWLSSLYLPYPYRTDDGREDLSASGLRVVRGGSWRYPAYYGRVAFRFGVPPEEWGSVLGVRCARTP